MVRIQKYSMKSMSIRKFLYILPFMILLGVFAYYPLYGWVYAFFDYTPPIPLSESPFVGSEMVSFLGRKPSKDRSNAASHSRTRLG